MQRMDIYEIFKNKKSVSKNLLIHSIIKFFQSAVLVTCFFFTNTLTTCLHYGHNF